MTNDEKDEIISMFVKNYTYIVRKNLAGLGIYDDDSDIVCAAALTIIETLKEGEKNHETV